MPYRSKELATGESYHIFNRSIAKFRIFDHPGNCERFVKAMRYYQAITPGVKLSRFMESRGKTDAMDCEIDFDVPQNDRLVDIVAYCLMPTHAHFILKQLKDGGISRYMSNLQNSYTRYFNTKYDRYGPLWSGRFKSVLIDSQEYFLYLTCYIHLNPTTAGLVGLPGQWPRSSFSEYCGQNYPRKDICDFKDLMDMEPLEYKKFVEDRIEDQKELELIKHLIIE